jgi:DNA-binding winged helix-turn-helix (wHTH) protein
VSSTPSPHGGRRARQHGNIRARLARLHTYAFRDLRRVGRLEVHAPGGRRVALPPSVQALVARLALSAGRVVSVDALTDALWGEDLPADAGNALQTRVSKLRRGLVAAGVPGEVPATRAPGYQLAVEPEAVDALRFERLVSRARALSREGKPDGVLAVLDEALGLWRGPALADVGDGEWTAAESTRLEELRLGAIEDRLELLTSKRIVIPADPDLVLPVRALPEDPIIIGRSVARRVRDLAMVPGVAVSVGWWVRYSWWVRYTRGMGCPASRPFTRDSPTHGSPYTGRCALHRQPPQPPHPSSRVTPPDPLTRTPAAPRYTPASPSPGRKEGLRGVKRTLRCMRPSRCATLSTDRYTRLAGA